MAKISDKDEIVDIYLKYQKSLLRLAMTYVDRSYLAEDIVGDTIIAVLERPLEFENEASCACYMRQTVRNKSISLLRRKYQIDLLDDANDIEKRIIELSSSDKSYNDIEVQVLLHEILAEYPKEIREAFIAHILDDETIPSLAAYYGIKNDTLRKQIGRMKTRIAQVLVITQTDSNAITRKNANEHAKKRLVKGISVQFKAIFKAEMQRAICKSFWAVFGLFEGSGAHSTILFKKSLKHL